MAVRAARSRWPSARRTAADSGGFRAILRGLRPGVRPSRREGGSRRPGSMPRAQSRRRARFAGGALRAVSRTVSGRGATATAPPVGGANFIAMPSARAGAAIVTANLNYIYVDAEMREDADNLRQLLEAVMACAAGLFQHGLPLVFIEQNDPFRMSAESYERDTRAGGIDQLDRLRIWARLGARVVDFPYVQPALSDGAGGGRQPDLFGARLVGAAAGRRRPALSPAPLLRDLRAEGPSRSKRIGRRPRNWTGWRR